METPAKPIELRQALAWLGGVGMLACALWSPIFIAFASKFERLDNEGHTTTGIVVDHSEYNRPNRATVFSARVRYTASSRIHHISLTGPGATPSRLPLQTPVLVRYLPNEPDFSEAHVAGADSGTRINWTFLYWAWGATSAALIWSYILSRSRLNRVQK